MRDLAIIARPISSTADAYLLICRNNTLEKFFFHKDQPLSITVDRSVRYCVGWYDIATHTNHLCESRSVVQNDHTSCWSCRRKTDFHPAFYNITTVSEKQKAYNRELHSAYISYFGSGLAKAGILSDSRGLERLFEQGALFYSIVARCANAIAAHSVERRLIQKGLKESVQNKQKAAVLKTPLNIEEEERAFTKILNHMGYYEKPVRTIDRFFFGSYPHKLIEEFAPTSAISGTVRGVVGRYLVLENTQRLYGLWLGGLTGYMVQLDAAVQKITPPPQQQSLL